MGGVVRSVTRLAGSLLGVDTTAATDAANKQAEVLAQTAEQSRQQSNWVAQQAAEQVRLQAERTAVTDAVQAQQAANVPTTLETKVGADTTPVRKKRAAFAGSNDPSASVRI